MAVLKWDQSGERKYETGVDRGVLFVQNINGTYGKGVAWNGLTGVTETPSGAEETKLYADNMKYLSLRSAEEFGGTIEAYTYPDEWQMCDGSANLATGVHVGQQARRSFGMSYRTVVGNDTALTDFGYKLHLVYGATVSPSERAYATINDSPEAITFSWEFTTTPIEIPAEVGDFKPTAILTIDTTELEGGKNNAALKDLEDLLYGTANSDPSLPLPSAVFDLFTPTYIYTEVTNPSVDDIATYYERSGEEGSYVYTLTEDVAINSEKTYYTRSEA